MRVPNPNVILEDGYWCSHYRVHMPPVRTCQVCDHEWRVDCVEGEYEGQWYMDDDDECWKCLELDAIAEAKK